MRTSFLLFLIIAISLPSQAQTDSALVDEQYTYDTILKGGYHISFQVDDSTQHLYLKKEGVTITELSSTSRGLLHKNLGYVGADFIDHFVLVQSFGSGNPHLIKLIRKSDGKNILNMGAAWIDVDVEKEYLLYSSRGVPDRTDKMILCNVRTKKKELFMFPSDIFKELSVLSRIHILRLTTKQLIIEYESDNISKTKTYRRH